ncbi:MAG: ABC transporter ATP-binding protein [Mariprofundales bacterium]|nr:ABC transporter ATP-binding protein [Mariprofundales bacterium]
MPNTTSLLSVRGLSKDFITPGGTISVLQQVDFSAERGEFLAIVGESGSGKSTLLQIVGTVESPDAGEVLLDGLSLFSLTSREQARLRNQKLGFVYQAHHLIPELTALENVMLPLQIRGDMTVQEIHQRAEALLGTLNLGQRLHHVPGKLSGGEAQRVAVARAMVGRPALLLADEPTGNLDESTAKRVFDTMLNLCREMDTAVVMVTHSRALALASDRVLQLHDGRISTKVRNYSASIENIP